MADIKKWRRRLPHVELVGSVYFSTFRLNEGELSDFERAIVFEHLKSGDRRFYRLWAATVMPDHVHIIFKPNPEMELSSVMKGIKGVTARKINESRGTKGKIWQHESWDRVILYEKELEEKLNYMYMNPVKRNLIRNPDDWQYWHCVLI